jgi:DNA-binding PadR family transcriptional regulator
VAKVGINLRRMEEDELVIKEKCRVKDKWRTLYVYFLTSKGEQEGRLLMEEKGKR